MLLYRLANLALLGAASACKYCTMGPREEQPSNPDSSMLGTAQKVLKWAKKGLHHISFGLQFGAFAKNLYSRARSSKAIELYTLFNGTFVLTYMNWKSPKTTQTLSQKIGNFAWSLTQESKKIMDAYRLIHGMVGLVKKPKDHVLPLAFAATMMIASYFASDQS